MPYCQFAECADDRRLQVKAHTTAIVRDTGSASGILDESLQSLSKLIPQGSALSVPDWANSLSVPLIGTYFPSYRELGAYLGLVDKDAQ